MDCGLPLLEAAVSEYQYYEFQAIDRPLTNREMADLRKLSTRAEITRTSFVNVYNWGNFRGNPARLMERYFDAFLYVSNFGGRELMLRLPRRHVDIRTASRYFCAPSATIKAKGRFVVLGFQDSGESDDGDRWEGGEGRLGSLSQLREAILDGDRTLFYLGWLLGVQQGDVEEEAVEPPVPAGLSRLDAPHRAFVDFFRIDRDLLAAAAQASPGKATPARSRPKAAAAVRRLKSAEKDKLLTRLLEGDARQVRSELAVRIRRGRPKEGALRPPEGARTAGKLLDAAGIR
jgi:hypothetical protein